MLLEKGVPKNSAKEEERLGMLKKDNNDREDQHYHHHNVKLLHQQHYWDHGNNTWILSIKIPLNGACWNHYLDSRCALTIMILAMMPLAICCKENIDETAFLDYSIFSNRSCYLFIVFPKSAASTRGRLLFTVFSLNIPLSKIFFIMFPLIYLLDIIFRYYLSDIIITYFFRHYTL